MEGRKCFCPKGDSKWSRQRRFQRRAVARIATRDRLDSGKIERHEFIVDFFHEPGAQPQGASHSRARMRSASRFFATEAQMADCAADGLAALWRAALRTSGRFRRIAALA